MVFLTLFVAVSISVTEFDAIETTAIAR